MLWAWLADFLSAALQGRALYVSYLSASPAFSFCQLPSNKMVSHEGGDGDGSRSQEKRPSAAASEGFGKINF